jgi:hypothetical protein
MKVEKSFKEKNFCGAKTIRWHLCFEPLETGSHSLNRGPSSAQLGLDVADAGAVVPAILVCPCCSMEDVAMRNLNLDPFWRTSVGFDRLFDLMDESFGLSRRIITPLATSFEPVRTSTAFRLRSLASSPSKSALPFTETR